MQSERVQVLVAGRYNNAQHRARRAQVEDIIEVAGGSYAASLIADGFVAPLDAPVEDSGTDNTPPLLAPTQTQAATGGTERKRAPRLIDVDGIGEKTLAKLEKLAITTLEELLAADAGTLADAVDGTTLEKAQDWQRQARTLLGV